LTRPEFVKIVLPPTLAVVLFVAAVFIIILPSFKMGLLNTKKEAAQELTNTAWNILAFYQSQELLGVLSREQAQSKAIAQIRAMRYGKENRDYFWINDEQPLMIMHPYRSDLEGKDLHSFTDPEGKRLFVAFVETVRSNGAGFVPYKWQWQDEPGHIVSKLSYVKGFPPWHWIIGTGIYLDEVERDIAAISSRAGLFSGVIAILVALLSGYIIFQHIVTAEQKRLAEKELARHQDHLETLIKERTLELAALNDTLKEEIREKETSEERYRDLFENAMDMIQCVRPDGVMLYVNKACRETLGYTEAELTGLTVFDLLHPDSFDHGKALFRLAARGERLDGFTLQFRNKNGTRVVVEGNANCLFNEGSPVMVRAILRDVTEKNRLEKELLKAHKLESLGLLAGGIAHDFNNLLTAILGNISLAKMFTSPGSKIFERLTEAEKASDRAKGLTYQLLTFAKGGAPVKKTSTISEIIVDSSEFIVHGATVRCKYNIAKDLWLVDADLNQISQVVQNLVLNAKQAMPDGGKIMILAENVNVEPNEKLPLPIGRYVRLSVIDQGVGIAEKNLQKIFDPYFTTRQEGSGLGLAVAYSVVKKHDGLITVDSKPGKGSAFHIYLPASMRQDQSRDHQPSSSGKNTTRPATSRGKILVMDDEEMVRNVAYEMLTQNGYAVETARDGREALDMYEAAMQNCSRYDVVILDITVTSGMGGQETIKNLLKLDPEVLAIVSSGYTMNPLMADYQQYGFKGVIPKPFHIEELLLMLDRVLTETIIC